MNDIIIKQALLCARTYFDESSKISPSMANRVHIVFEEIFNILLRLSGISDLEQKLKHLNEHMQDVEFKENLTKQLISNITDMKEIALLNQHLKYLAEFGRILPFEGPSYYELSEPNKIDDQIHFLKEGLIKHKLVKKSTTAPIAIILPFRIANKFRLRNLLSSLLGIHNSFIDKSKYSIIAVNQDAEDCYEDVISDYVDHYIFAKNETAYNVSWARNIGAVCGRESEILLFWDIDIVAPRELINKIYESFDDSIGCVVPYTSGINLNERSTSYFIEHIPSTIAYNSLMDNLNGQVMHEVYGFMIAVRSNEYFKIGGFDERYEGWGDEDNDFYSRIYASTKIRRLNLPIYHLDHPRPLMRIEGEKLNRNLINDPISEQDNIGVLNKYSS